MEDYDNPFGMSEEEFLYRAMNIEDPMYMGDYPPSEEYPCDYPPSEEYPCDYEQPCQAPYWENDEYGPGDCASW